MIPLVGPSSIISPKSDLCSERLWLFDLWNFDIALTQLFKVVAGREISYNKTCVQIQWVR